MDQDGSRLAGARIALVPVPMSTPNPLAFTIANSNGEADITIATTQTLGGMRVMACRYDSGQRFLWGQRDLDGADVRKAADSVIEIQIPRESIILCRLEDGAGAPIPHVRVPITFIWRAGLGDPAHGTFLKLRGIGDNELVRHTDDRGEFQVAQVPGCIVLAFFLFENDGCRHQTISNLSVHQESAFVFAPVLGTYHATIRRAANPLFRVLTSLPKGMSAKDMQVTATIERIVGDPRFNQCESGSAADDGTFSFQLSIHTDSTPEMLEGHRIWICIHHPELGMFFREGRIDTRTYTQQVSIERPEGALELEGVIQNDGVPISNARLTLKSGLFSNGLCVMKTDGEGRFRVSHLATVPASWSGLCTLEDTWEVESRDPTLSLEFHATGKSKVAVLPGRPNILEAVIEK